MIRKWFKRRNASVPEVDVESLMGELNVALQRDFDLRRDREIHGKTVPELMEERDARERAAFNAIIRASWPNTTDN